MPASSLVDWDRPAINAMDGVDATGGAELDPRSNNGSVPPAACHAQAVLEPATVMTTFVTQAEVMAMRQMPVQPDSCQPVAPAAAAAAPLPPPPTKYDLAFALRLRDTLLEASERGYAALPAALPAVDALTLLEDGFQALKCEPSMVEVGIMRPLPRTCDKSGPQQLRGAHAFLCQRMGVAWRPMPVHAPCMHAP